MWRRLANMKKLIIIGFSSYSLEIHAAVLRKIFRTDLDIQVISITQLNSGLIELKPDFILCTSSIFVYQAKKYFGDSSQIIIVEYTLKKNEISQIHEFCNRGEVTIAASGLRIASSRKLLLNNLGFQNTHFLIWSPGMNADKLSKYVVVFGSCSIPNLSSHQIIEIPHRSLSALTICQIILSLNHVELFQSPPFYQYLSEIKLDPKNLYQNHHPNLKDELYFENDSYSQGVLSFTKNYTIAMANAYIEKITAMPHDMLIDQKIYEVFPFLKKYIKNGDIENFQESIECFQGNQYLVEIYFYSLHETFIGYLKMTEYSNIEKKQSHLQSQIISKHYRAKYQFGDIIGTSKELSLCKETAMKIALTDSNVLITGETGTGKELFAQAIHNSSSRRSFPFVAINCGAITESLLESELFGYEKGSFTGADKNGRQGLFEIADYGTLFLDEIGDMPLGLQVKLLRVLQEKEIVRVGGHKVIPVNIRIIAATNKNLSQMVEQGKFRDDLLYRINVLPLEIPPLRKRKEDIKNLIDHLIAQRHYSFVISRAAIERILSYPFPGNVRELQNCVDYMNSTGVTCIEISHLPPYILQYKSPQPIETCSHMAGLQLDISDYEWEAKEILMAIKQMISLGFHPSRRELKKYFNNKNIPISENRIRKVFIELETKNLIRVYPGKRGIELTQQGINFIHL